MAGKKALLIMFVMWGLSYPLKRAYSQIVYGNIIGTVTDSSGAAIPGAKVTITNVGTTVNTTTTTNQSGNYTQLHLAAATYSVKVEASGFQTFVNQNVTVTPDSSVQVNAQMKLGQVTQEVNVTAAPPNLQTQKTDIHTLYTAQTLSDLPTLNRNFAYFELFSPGAQELGWQHASDENPQGSIQMMVNGQPFAGTGWFLDGTDNHDEILGIMVVNPNIDSLQDAKVITSDYSAEYGDATAGVITATTKSGTNQIHGTAFEYHRSAFGEARDPFANVGGSVPSTVYNQFGGSLGGPIRKDKTFIFGDFQGSRQRIGDSFLNFVPTAAERSGDLSALTTNIYNPFGANGQILTPAARTQFAGNVIPTGMLSAQAEKLLSSYIPLPNIPGAVGGAPNFFSGGSLTFDTNNFDVKVDQYQTDKLHIFGRYTFQQFLMTGPGAFGTEAGGPNPASGSIRYAGDSSSRDQSLASGFDYTLSPNLLTDFRFAFFRYRVIDNPNGLTTTPATDAGIPGLNVSAISGGMPGFFIGGNNGDGSPGGFEFGYALGINGCNCPLNQQEQQFQFVDNWTYIHGNHTVEFGTDLRHLQNLRVPSDFHRAGEVSFCPAFTQGPGGAGGLGLAAFLMGDVTNFDRYVSNVTDAAERQNREFFFGQDTWRITPKLSFNYGLRWEIYNPQYVNSAGNGGWVKLSNGETYIAGEQGTPLSGPIQNSYKNFGPRVGIAYQINQKTVLRMGYGRFFDSGVFGTTFGHTVTQNLPVLGQQSVQPANNFQNVFALNQGPPAFNPATALTSSVKEPDGHYLYPVGVTPKVLPLTMRLPTVDAWNVTLQREINPSANLSLAWVGNKGTHVFVGDGPCYNINQPTVVGYNPSSPTGLSTNQREPFFAKYGWNQSIAWFGNDVSNNYESLQAVFDKRFTKDYMIHASYVWSRDFNFNNSYYIYSPAFAYGPTDFNRTNALIIQNIYNLPFGKGERFGSTASKWVNDVIGGWQLNGVTTLESGLPFTPSLKNCSAFEDVGYCNPNRVGNVTLGNRTQNQWFPTVQTPGNVGLSPGQTLGPWGEPAAGVLGNMAFNSMYGPHLFDSDLSLFKSVQITEKLRGQFEADFFNAFNVANLGLPNGCVDCGRSNQSGMITSTAAGTIMRTMQFGLHLYW